MLLLAAEAARSPGMGAMSNVEKRLEKLSQRTTFTLPALQPLRRNDRRAHPPNGAHERLGTIHQWLCCSRSTSRCPVVDEDI